MEAPGQLTAQFAPPLNPALVLPGFRFTEARPAGTSRQAYLKLEFVGEEDAPPADALSVRAQIGGDVDVATLVVREVQLLPHVVALTHLHTLVGVEFNAPLDTV